RTRTIVDAQLDKSRTIAGGTRLLRNRGAQHLRRRGAGIDVEPVRVFPRGIIREIHAVIVGRALPAAMTTIARTAEVTSLDAGAIDADERAIDLRVAVPRTIENSLQLVDLRRRHDQLVRGRTSAIGRVIDLKHGIRI